ncbi:MAG: hypothetical protein KatS3mg102_0301 [Planctomycetota bacterium]|nr:MAG: hypothetical protein KatS3mg102_0301 [Planctomycetota bacterium]
MDRVLAIDHQAGTVTVEGGIRLAALVRALAAQGLALPNLGSIAAQSVAGAIATGTHGTGLRLGNLSSFVRGLRLLTPSGEAIELREGGGEGELLAAARVHLGCLGAVTQVTLACVPAFRLRERAAPCGFSEALAQPGGLARAARVRQAVVVAPGRRGAGVPLRPDRAAAGA